MQWKRYFRYFSGSSRRGELELSSVGPCTVGCIRPRQRRRSTTHLNRCMRMYREHCCLYKMKTKNYMQRLMTNRKKTHLHAAPLTGCREPLRLFLFAVIIASAPSLESCGSSKEVMSTTTSQQVNTDVQTGVSLELSGLDDCLKLEISELVLPIQAVANLPEGAEYSHQDGDLRVSAQRTKGDSLRIRAMGLGPPMPKIKVEANSSGTVKLADSTDAKVGKGIPELPRGQPAEKSNIGWDLVFVCIMFLVLTGMIAYESNKHKKQK